MGQQHPWAGLIDTGVNAVPTPCQGTRQTNHLQKTPSYHQQDMGHTPACSVSLLQIRCIFQTRRTIPQTATWLVGYGGWG